QPSDLEPLLAVEIGKIAHLAEHMRCNDQPAEPADQIRKQIEIPYCEVSCALELRYTSLVDLTDQKQNQEIGIDQNSFRLMLLDQRSGVQHQASPNSRIFIDVTSPVLLSTVKLL